MGSVRTDSGRPDEPAPGLLDELSAPPRPAGRLDPGRCSVRALGRGDSPVATASPAQRWLLIEQPGPWGREALAESRFDQSVVPELARRSRAEGVRLLLIRRPGDRLPHSGPRWGLADRPAPPGGAGGG